MNSGVSWQVQGVRQQARDAALETVRRPDGLPGLDQLSTQIHSSGRSGQDAVSQYATGQGGQDAASQYAAGQVTDAISRLERRLDQFMAKGGSAISEIERRLNAVDNTVAQLNRGSSRPNGAPTSPLDQALFEIAERQRALDGERPRNDPARAPTQDLGGLEQQLRAITDRVETLQPCGIDNTVEALRGDLAEIGEMLKDAMPRHVVEGLEAGVRQLVERIDAQRHINIDSAAFANLERGLAEVRDVVQALAPMESRVEFDETVRTLSRRVDDIETNKQSSIAFEQLEGAIVGLRAIVSHVASNDALTTLSDEVRTLTTKIEQTSERSRAEVRDVVQALTPMESRGEFDESVRTLSKKFDDIDTNKQNSIAFEHLEGAIVGLRDMVSEEVRTLTAKVEQTSTSGVLENIEQRIAMLADALQARNLATENTQAIENSIQLLFEQIDRLQLTRSEQVAVHQLETQIAQLVERVEASGPHFAKLETIERALADLHGYLKQHQVSQTVPKTEAERADANTIKRDVQRTQDTLDSIHGTLNQLVDRFAGVEIGKHGAASAVPDAENIQLSARSRAREESLAPLPLAMDPQLSAAAFMQIAQASNGDRTERRDPARGKQPVGVAPTPANASSDNQTLKLERPPIDPNLPPDHPLEPGIRGRSVPSPAERIAMSQSALGPTKPVGESEPDGKVNFIAAARRAAQAAASIEGTSARVATSPVEPLQSGTQKTSGSGKRLRAILVATSTTIVVLGSLYLVWNVISAPQSSDENMPPAAVESTPDRINTGPASSSVPNDETPDMSTPPAETIPSGTGQRSNLLPDGTAFPPTAAGILLPANPGGFAALPKVATFPEPKTTASIPASPMPASSTRSLSMQSPSAQAPATQSPAMQSPVAQPPATSAPSLASVASRAAAPPATTPPSPARTGTPDRFPATIGGAALRAAAAKGDPAAEFEIASRLAEGRGVPRDLTAAAEWFERAAKQGLAPAQVRLGSLYEKGLGVKKNLETARRHYLSAAEAGNARAMHNLAVLHADGTDAKPDYQNSAKWFRKAADYGITDSQYNLAILYVRGIGTEPNLGEAYRWFAIAAREGDAEAAKKRDDIASRLDRSTLAAARAAAEAWSAQPQIEAATDVQSPPGGWDKPAAAPLAGKNRSSQKTEAARLGPMQ
jgi:localization factor PodJL